MTEHNLQNTLYQKDLESSPRHSRFMANLLRDAYPPSRGHNHGFSLAVVTNKYFQGRWLIC